MTAPWSPEATGTLAQTTPAQQSRGWEPPSPPRCRPHWRASPLRAAPAAARPRPRQAARPAPSPARAASLTRSLSPALRRRGWTKGLGTVGGQKDCCLGSGSTRGAMLRAATPGDCAWAAAGSGGRATPACLGRPCPRRGAPPRGRALRAGAGGQAARGRAAAALQVSRGDGAEAGAARRKPAGGAGGSSPLPRPGGRGSPALPYPALPCPSVPCPPPGCSALAAAPYVSSKQCGAVVEAPFAARYRSWVLRRHRLLGGLLPEGRIPSRSGHPF